MYLLDVNATLLHSFLAFWPHSISWPALTFLCRNEGEWVSSESQKYWIMYS